MTSTLLAPLVDGDAILRPLLPTDLGTTLAWRNDPASARWFHSTAPVFPEDHREWFARYLRRETDYMFILEANGTPVAQTSLYGVEGDSAEFGRLLVDPFRRGQGLSHRAVALCLRIADDVLALKHLQLEVKPDNVRAIRVYEAAGFIRDADARGAGTSLVMRRTTS